MVMGEMVIEGKKLVEIPPLCYSGFAYIHLWLCLHKIEIFPSFIWEQACSDSISVHRPLLASKPSHPCFLNLLLSWGHPCMALHHSSVGPLAALALLPRAQHSSIVGITAAKHIFPGYAAARGLLQRSWTWQSLQSQAGRSTVVLAREVSQLPGPLSLLPGTEPGLA